MNFKLTKKENEIENKKETNFFFNLKKENNSFVVAGVVGCVALIISIWGWWCKIVKIVCEIVSNLWGSECN